MLMVFLKTIFLTHHLEPQVQWFEFWNSGDARQRLNDGDIILDWRASLKLNKNITITAIIDNLLNREYHLDLHILDLKNLYSET